MAGAVRRIAARTGVSLVALALAAVAFVAQAAPDLPETDGWYAWETEAGGAAACCYSRTGATTRRGCNLDGRGPGLSVGEDCGDRSGRLRIFVRVEDGIPTGVRALSSDCPVALARPAHDLGGLARGESIERLSDLVAGHPAIADDAIAAISLHGGTEAYRPLAAIVSDRSREQRLRETALFWLAQLETPEAADFLERLLSAR